MKEKKVHTHDPPTPQSGNKPAWQASAFVFWKIQWQVL